MVLMHPCGSLEVCQTPKSHNALIDLFKFISYVQINTRITSSLRFLYIFNQSGLLCAAALVSLPTRRAIVEAAAVGGLEDDSKDKWPPLRMSLLA